MMNSTKDTSEAKVLPKEESNGLSIANSTLEATLSILNSYIYFKCKNSLEKVNAVASAIWKQQETIAIFIYQTAKR